MDSSLTTLVLAKVMGMYKYYYRQRVLMTPEDYRAEMTTGRVGRLDLDGICPYTGEDDDGSLRRPTEEELDVMFRAKAKEEEWMQGEMMYGGRPRNMLMTVVKTLEIYEELMGAIGARWIQAWGSPISYSNEQNEGHLRRKERDESQNEQLPM